MKVLLLVLVLIVMPGLSYAAMGNMCVYTHRCGGTGPCGGFCNTICVYDAACDTQVGTCPFICLEGQVQNPYPDCSCVEIVVTICPLGEYKDVYGDCHPCPLPEDADLVDCTLFADDGIASCELLVLPPVGTLGGVDCIMQNESGTFELTQSCPLSL